MVGIPSWLASHNSGAVGSRDESFLIQQIAGKHFNMPSVGPNTQICVEGIVGIKIDRRRRNRRRFSELIAGVGK